MTADLTPAAASVLGAMRRLPAARQRDGIRPEFAARHLAAAAGARVASRQAGVAAMRELLAAGLIERADVPGAYRAR